MANWIVQQSTFKYKIWGSIDSNKNVYLCINYSEALKLDHNKHNIRFRFLK